MAYRVHYDDPKTEELSTLIAPGAGEASEMRALDQRIRDGDPGERFTITDDASETLVEGTFWGPDSDRDVPLTIARIHAENAEADPSRLEYAGGTVYIFRRDWNAVVPTD